MKAKTVILLTFLLLFINVTVFYITETSLKHKTDLVLQENLKTLQTHYKILLETQKSTAIAIYELTKGIPEVSKILFEANSASKMRKAELREELAELLAPIYKVIQKRGVLQYQFVFPNNESFYRAHTPQIYGDNLTHTRADFKYTNEYKKPIRCFIQGRTAHGFRNIFPLFDKNNSYVGAVEISFSSDSFQWYLNNVSGIHSHFIIRKNIFDMNPQKYNDLIIKYDKSSEASDYMITLSSIHTKGRCIDENKKRLEPIREEIDVKMAQGEAFSSYVIHQKHVDVVSFLPIKNMENKSVAWIITYEKSPIIKMGLQNNSHIRMIAFFLSLLIIYFLVKQILTKEKIHRQHQLLNDILNTTDDIMMITDFKDLKYSNDKFKKIISRHNLEHFNEYSKHDILSIFLQREGSLHRGLLREGENFAALIFRTAPKDRVVTILSSDGEELVYKISISKSKNSQEYVVTLSDITKIKEYQLQTEKKAYLDSLTQVYNRTKFDEILEHELRRAARYDEPLSMAILDIDRFKDFNDKYGHIIGDEVLVMLAKTVKSKLRGTDVFARWGGEEFVILFQNLSAEKAKKVAEKLKDSIEANQHPVAGKITASFGLCEYVDGDSAKSMFKRCDEALYLAKANGRNRVEVL